MRTDLNFYHERGWAKRAVQKQMWPCLILESVCDQQVKFLQIVSVILLASNHCIQSGHGTKKASQHRLLSTANHNQAAVTPRARVQFLKRGSSLVFCCHGFLNVTTRWVSQGKHQMLLSHVSKRARILEKCRMVTVYVYIAVPFELKRSR